MRADVLYAATDQGVLRSPDAGISWSRCSESKVTTSVLVLQDGRTVLAGTSDGSVLRSVDSGDHWTAITRGIPGVPFHRAGNGLRRYERGIRGFERCRSDLGTEEHRSRGRDAGGIADTTHRNCRALAGCRHAGHGNPLTAGSGVLRDEGRRQPLETSAVVDEQTGRFYAGTDTKGVYVSQDGGTSWSRSSSGLSAILSVSGAVNTIAVARDGIVYAGTQARGAAMSRDEGAAWQRLNSGLPDLDVQHIVVAGGGVFTMTAHCVVRPQT
jgi:photosystem II stability/assembly factor-like uncharacterized protein